ncbi:glycosyltransferase family 39 protein [Candidatus Uhrbacteria bacterium]|nr:glycosyltransferase family 39 protein [Candidatus Uhrbacteria bacterium]
MVLFYRTFSVGFLADDYDFIDAVYEARATKHPVVTLLTSPIGGSSFFRPVVNLSFWVDYQLFGTTPFGYHLTNLLLFGSSVALLILIAVRLIGNKVQAWLVGILFLVSPFSAESVVWIAGRTDLVMLFFLLLSVWWYVEYRRTRIQRYLLLFGMTTLLTFFGKENGIVLVGALVGIDCLYFQTYKSFFGKSLRETMTIVWPYLIMVLGLIIFFLVRYRILGHFMYENNAAGFPRFFIGDIHHLWKFLRLFGTGVMHANGFEWWGIDRTMYLIVYGIGSLGILTTFILGVIKKSWHGVRDMMFGIFLTFVFLAPLLGYMTLITSEHQNMRFIFTPSIGIAWSIAAVLSLAYNTWTRYIASVSLLSIILVWGAASLYGQIPYMEASTAVRLALARVKEQILPAVQSVFSPGIYVLGLPRVVHGAYALSNYGINRAMRVAYPELAGAETLNVSTIARHGAACQVIDGQRAKETVFLYQYDQSVGYRALPFSERLTADRAPLQLREGFSAGGDPIAFPFTYAAAANVGRWRYRGAPIDPGGLKTFRIPMQLLRSGPLGPSAHIRWRFLESNDRVQLDKNFFLTIPVKDADIERGFVEVQLCEYPLFYQPRRIAMMSFEWKGLSHAVIEVGAPVFY